jgi:putative nucleotidyltransferase with HDIG domain
VSKEIKIEDAPELKDALSDKDSDSFPFESIDIKILSTAGRALCCDVFIKISDTKMTRVFSVETGLDFLRLKQYVDKGVKEVFVRKEDLTSFTAYLKHSPEQVFQNADASKEEKVNALLDLADQTVVDFFTKMPIPDVSVEKTKAIIKRMLHSLAKDPNLLGKLMRMVQHHEFILSHSISVSIIAMLIARGAQNANEKTLELCGIGGFLHDIGKTQISQSIVAKYSDMTPEQWKEMRHHPLLGVKMLEECKNVSDEVKLIILQHHEQPGGSGYPSGLRGPKLFYPSKIVAIADTFAAMVSPQANRRIYTPEQALYEMGQEPGKYDKDLLAVTAQMFKIKT